MRVPLSWLAEFIELDESPEDISERLSLCAIEVDEIERPGDALKGVVVGRLEEVAKHPGADKLTVCKVDIGSGELLPIVCGASNHKQGDYVAVATVKTVLPGDFKIKKSKIRGEVSKGMLCSLSELGFSGEYDGILILDGEPTVGSAVAELIGIEKAILDIDILPDRGDCTSVLGVARELSALYEKPVTQPDYSVSETGAAASDSVSVENRAAAACYNYGARVVRGLSVGPSPDWLVKRLEALGLRPINNVVDATNFVLMELGQPLHAFDAALIPNGKIIVRQAQEGETIKLLDDEEAKLSAEDLVIADETRGIALAGVMGGADTAVSKSTTDIILESAHFNPSGIRRTVRCHSLRSDSSYRFERGVDPEGVLRALDRASQLIVELAGGEVATGVVRAAGDAVPRPGVTELATSRVHRILGLSFSVAEIQARLERVGVEVTAKGESLQCTPPSWRLDLVQEADYIEEILRLDGYEDLPETLPLGPVSVRRPLPLLRQNAALRETLIQHGFSEVRNLAFVSGAEMSGLGYAEEDDERARLVALQNPLGEEMAYMRSSLVPALLKGAAYNLRRGVKEVRQFELAKTYFSRGAGNLPEERRVLAGILVPNEDPRFWGASDEFTPFFQAKGALVAAMAKERLDGVVEPAQSPAPYLHPAATGVVKVGETEVGLLGRIHPALAKRAELSENSVLFHLELDALLEIPSETPSYAEAPKHQSAQRDFAILVDAALSAGQVEAEIRRLASRQLGELECFDQYEGKGVPGGRKSLAFRLTLRAKDRTLKESEVSKTVDRVLAGLESALGAQRR